MVSTEKMQVRTAGGNNFFCAVFEGGRTGFATCGHDEYVVRRYRPLLEGSVSVALICSPGSAVGAKLSSRAHGDVHVVSETRPSTTVPVRYTV